MRYVRVKLAEIDSYLLFASNNIKRCKKLNDDTNEDFKRAKDSVLKALEEMEKIENGYSLFNT